MKHFFRIDHKIMETTKFYDTCSYISVLFQGPQGVANFSQCSYYNHSSEAVASDRFPSYSIWLPTEVDLDVSILP
jgi:hypothetical protein